MSEAIARTTNELDYWRSLTPPQRNTSKFWIEALLPTIRIFQVLSKATKYASGGCGVALPVYEVCTTQYEGAAITAGALALGRVIFGKIDNHLKSQRAAGVEALMHISTANLEHAQAQYERILDGPGQDT